MELTWWDKAKYFLSKAGRYKAGGKIFGKKAVDDGMAIIVQAQLLFLSQQDPDKTITMHIDSPGGCVKAGLSMVDVMSYIEAKIQTINTGMAASMGSILLGAGYKGMRSSLKHSKTMLHQSSGGAIGNIVDARITMDEWEKNK